MPIILRDLMYYLAGFFFGISGMTTSQCVELYELLKLQNNYTMKLYKQSRYIARKEQADQVDIELMHMKLI